MLQQAMTIRRFFLARHGNRQDFVDPAWPTAAEEPHDPPLSADGVEQARRLGQRLAGEGIRVIVSSPYLRAVQTAHHANEALGVPIFLEPGFGEYYSAEHFERYPLLQSIDALRRDYPSVDEGYVATRQLRYPETVPELRERTHHVIGTLLERFEGDLLIVSHAAPVAAAVLIDENVKSVECPLCALFCLEFDGQRWRLTLEAEVTHVGERRAVFRFPQSDS
jgi:broad specificity phosphatase PhoE